MTIKLGDRAKDLISGFEGIVVGRSEWLAGCPTLTIQPEKSKGNSLPDAKTFDEPGCELLKSGVRNRVILAQAPVTLNLGDRVRDRITKFEGIVTGKTEWLMGCNRVCIQPEKLKDGKPVDRLSFDEILCVLLKRAVINSDGTSGVKVPAKKSSTGGPQPEPTRDRNPQFYH